MPKSEHEYEWLFVFLVFNSTFYDKGNLKNKDNKIGDGKIEFIEGYYPMYVQTNYLKHQLKSVSTGNNVKIVIAEYYECEYKQETKFTLKENDNNGKYVDFKHDTINLSGDMLNENSVQLIFKGINNKYGGIKKKAVVTYGHGTFFGINFHAKITENDKPIDYNNLKYYNKYLSKFSEASKNNFSINFKKEHFNKFLLKEIKYKNVTLEHFFDNVLTDFQDLGNYRNIKMLTNEELSNAIKGTFGSVNLLVMYNCLMQNIFTQYEFRETVEWLVAPQTGIGYPGFSFDKVLQKIENEKNCTPEILADFFLTSIRDSNIYISTSSIQDYIEDVWCVLAVKLKTQDKLFEQIQICYVKWIAEILKFNDHDGNVIFLIIKNINSHLLNYSKDTIREINVIDWKVFLKYFIDGLQTSTNLSSNIKILIQISNTAYDLLDKIEAKYFVGNNFWLLNRPVHYLDENSNKFVFKGSSIILPIVWPLKFEPLKTIFIESQSKKDYIPSFLRNTNTLSLIRKFRKDFN